MTSATAHAFDPPQLEAANLLNLVIVDDERAVRDVCREVAQSLGFNALVAESAEHTYRLLESQAIDVVLLDLKLPGACSSWPAVTAERSAGITTRAARRCEKRGSPHGPVHAGRSLSSWRFLLCEVP